MSESTKQTINRADPNTLADIARALQLGSLLRALPAFLRKSGTAASTFVNAGTRIATKQADDAPAIFVFSAYARAGSGTPAILAKAAAYPPVAGEYDIAPNGKVVTAAADAWTDLDVDYQSNKGDVVEFDAPVVPGTGILTLPPSITTLGAITLLEATALTGTSTGAKIVMAPGSVAAGQAAFNTAKTQVKFAAADAVETAHVKLFVASSVDVNALLESTSNYV